MKKTLSFLSLLFLLVTFQACKSDDELQTPVVNNKYYTTTNDINILKENAMQYIQENVINDSLIVFSSNTPEDALPQVGANLYVPVSSKTPYGMLVKVLSIDKGSTVKVQTEALPLEDAFEYLSVDTTLSVITELEGIFDKDGNPIEYEIVDTVEINNPNIEDVVQVKSVSTRTSFTYDWDWKKECLKFPIKLYKGESGKDKIIINGMVYVGFDKFDLDIDVNKFKVNYINLDAKPYIKLAAETTVTTDSKIELEDRIGQLRFRVTIPTPIEIPIIVPITLYIYGTCGIKGELSAKMGLQYKYNCNCVATYKNGQWISKATHGGFDNKNPWIVSEFDVKGEIYSGARLGLLAGLYSATTGIGFNVTPNFSLSAEAKLSSPNLLKANPEVGLNLLVGGDVYCIAEIFSKKLGKYSLEFPDYTLWSTKMYLLPNIENFTTVGANTSADISWSHNGLYFLEPLGIKTGTTIFEDDQTTERVSYTPSPTSKNNMGYCTYNVTATNLNSGSTYYAAPFASWKDFKWYGDKEEFTTGDSEERRLLIEFYHSTNGDNWLNNANWCSSKPLKEWYGITTDESGYVTSIKLPNNNLTGKARIRFGDFSHLANINIDDNKIEELSIDGNNDIDYISLNDCATSHIHFDGIKKVEISCGTLSYLSGSCETLKVSNCDFGDNHTPFSGISAKDATICNCKMHSCGLSSETLTFESSSTYDTWYCYTSRRLNIINSHCSTICGWDFKDNTVIYLQNASLWRSNWDEDSRVTLSCTTTGAGWDALFGH